jgi:hypothetical protein
MGRKKAAPSPAVEVPPSIWGTEVKIDWRGLIKSLAKATARLAQLDAGKDPVSVGVQLTDSMVDAVFTIGLSRTPGQLAGLLFQRAMACAVLNLLSESGADLRSRALRAVPEDVLDRLDGALEESTIRLDEFLFRYPGSLPIIRPVATQVASWLIQAGMERAAAEAAGRRLPGYFAYALCHEWRRKPEEYAPLQPQALETPFSQAARREWAWAEYSAQLVRRLDERLLNETFSLRDVYIRSRGCFDRHNTSKEGPDIRFLGVRRLSLQKTYRVLDYVDEFLQAWLERADPNQAIQVIEGGPGAGKSSVARMFAAAVAENGAWRVLFVPLHHESFQLEGDLPRSVAAFFKATGTLDVGDPLAPDDPKPLLLILDGVDELAKAGKVGGAVVSDFVEHVQAALAKLNYGKEKARVMALLLGRPVAVDAARTFFRAEGQVVEVLPYFISYRGGVKIFWEDPANLRKVDQRDEWWQKYAIAVGGEWDGVPSELRTPELDEMTAQPLLNYLLAFSWRERRKEGHGAGDTGQFGWSDNINRVYEEMLNRIHQHIWESGKAHPAVSRLSERQFIELLEEVALAAWQTGNERTTTAAAVLERLTENQRKWLAELQVEDTAGVLRLFLAFFMWPSGPEKQGTYEFTHKTFAEYLTARRLVRQLDMMGKDYASLSERSRWKQDTVLKEWAEFCGLAPLGDGVFDFLCRELALASKPDEKEGVAEWQEMLVKLINYLLHNGMPMHQVIRARTFQEMLVQSGNAETTLLAALSHCARVTLRVSHIDWTGEMSAGNWIMWLGGISPSENNSVAVRSLYGLDLSHQYLSQLDLSDADLTMADLEGAHLEGAVLAGAALREARLIQANLRRAWITSADLRGARLQGADLRGAELDGADLAGANLDGANLAGASIAEEQLKQALGTPTLLPDGTRPAAGNATPAPAPELPQGAEAASPE